MEWVIESYDRRTDRDGENRFTTEVSFTKASEDLLNKLGLESRLPAVAGWWSVLETRRRERSG
jgi:hypothetical protein